MFIKALGAALELGSAPEQENDLVGCHSGLRSWKRLIVLLIQGRKLEILVKTAGGVPTLSPWETMPWATLLHTGNFQVPLRGRGEGTLFSRPPHPCCPLPALREDEA